MRQHFTALLVYLTLVSGAVSAGPLEDAVARVAELNLLVQSQNERITRLETQMQSQGLLSMLNQLDALKADIALLRGEQEEQMHRQGVADKRTRDLYVDLDERIKELANRPVATSFDSIRLQPSKTLVAAPMAPVENVDQESEARAYEAAHGMIKTGRYLDAISAFQSFIGQFPSGKLAANALYWIGIAQVTGQSDFNAAANSYQRILREYPSSPKVPDAMLSLARAQIQLEDKISARETLSQLLLKHPFSKAAENGKKLLTILN
jgi:tol-pal system protein YbgF